MTVIDVHKDLTDLTMTVRAQFDAPVPRVWQLWSDPRQLERWWGPPMFPATFQAHDLVPGGMARYFMTSPEGQQFHGWWRVLDVQPPRLLSVEDGFADEHGNHNAELPTTTMHVELTDRDGGGTNVTITSLFGTIEQLEQLIEMGMEEGLQSAMGQMDAILAE
jgi:uncharacterized protein YndB with AHSA1/START domain